MPDPKTKSDDFYNLIGLLVILAIVGFFTLQKYYFQMQLQSAIPPFLDPAYTEYRVEVDFTILEKMIVIDVAKKKADLLMWDRSFPKALRAKTAEEVGTVVWLEWGKTEAGSYNSGAQAYRRTCKITLFDLKRKIYKPSYHVHSEVSPPKMKNNDADWVSPKPTGEVIRYLKSLIKTPDPME